MKIDIKKLDIVLARKGLSYKDLAETMGISYRSLYHLLHQSKNPRPASVGSLAQKLGVNVTEIVSLTE